MGQFLRAWQPFDLTAAGHDLIRLARAQGWRVVVLPLCCEGRTPGQPPIFQVFSLDGLTLRRVTGVVTLSMAIHHARNARRRLVLADRNLAVP